jgi:hypothetical protein
VFFLQRKLFFNIFFDLAQPFYKNQFVSSDFEQEQRLERRFPIRYQQQAILISKWVAAISSKPFAL